MGRENKKKGVGSIDGRTDLDVQGVKRMRIIIEDENEHSDNYSTSSDEYSVMGNPSSLCFAPNFLNAPRMSSLAQFKRINQSPRKESLENINSVKIPSSRQHATESDIPKQIRDKKKLFTFKRRTGKYLNTDEEIKESTAIDDKISNARVQSAKYASQAKKRINQKEYNNENLDNDSDAGEEIEESTAVDDKVPGAQSAKYALQTKIRTNQKKCRNENLDNGSNGDNHAELTSKSVASKLKRKKNLPVTKPQNKFGKAENHPRRSQRKRFPPLETWRNQHLRINYENGNIANVEIEEGFSPITTHLDRIRKSMEQYRFIKSTKRKLEDNAKNYKQVKKYLKKTKVLNPETEEEQFVQLHQPSSTFLWSILPPEDQKTASYSITKVINSDLISFGLIEINGGKEKEEKTSHQHNIVFNVVKGNHIKITIHKTSFDLNNMDFITVPAGNSYSIQNNGKTNAILNFTAFKAPIFDYQFPETH